MLPETHLPSSARTVILGIGNPLLSDEGVGVHAVRWLDDNIDEHQKHQLNIDFVDGGTIGFALSGLIGDADQIVIIDAAELHSEPGTIRVFTGEGMDQFLGQRQSLAVHEVSLLDVLSVVLLEDRLPVKRAIIGIQPASLEWGETPTEPVARSIPEACHAALDLVRGWLQ